MHDFQAVYRRDSWDARAADEVHLTASVQLPATAVHTSQDLSVSPVVDGPRPAGRPEGSL